MKIIRISAIWCPSCIVMKKRWTNVQKEYPNLEIEDYDYDMDEDYCKNLDIGKKLPVCIFIKDGKETDRMIGEKTEKEIKEIIKKYEVNT